jgi:hypothetical protein
MSEVKVNKISPRSGTGVQLGDSGDTITIPAGATFDSSAATNTLPSTVVTTTGTQTLTNKTIDGSQLTDETVTTAKLAYNPNAFRNIIINGDMSIAQRGTSTAGVTSDGYYSIDRMKTANTTMGTWTQSQETDVPTGQGFATSLKMDCTTADASPSAGDRIMVRQFIEGKMLQYLKKGTANAESVTASFWVKSNKTGTYILEIFDADNTRQISKSYTIDVADTWEKKIITFAGDTTGTIANDNGDSFHFGFWLGAGSNYTSGTLNTSWNTNTTANRAVGQVNLADDTANEWYITGVQLEAGTTASDFEFLPVDVNLQRCLRYCWKHGGEAAGQFLNAHAGYNDANYLAFGLVSPPVPMRVAPSLTENGTVIVHRLNTDYSGWTWGFITGVQSQSWFVSGNKTSHGVTAASSVIKCATTSDFFIYSSEL